MLPGFYCLYLANLDAPLPPKKCGMLEMLRLLQGATAQVGLNSKPWVEAAVVPHSVSICVYLSPN